MDLNMRAKRIPLRLDRAPLIDGLIEVRFLSSDSLADKAPGFFLQTLAGISGMETLPPAQIPRTIRESDQRTKHLGLYRLHWNNFLIMFGDQMVNVGSKIPYAGWSELRGAMLQVLELLSAYEFLHSVERYSCKSTNILAAYGGISGNQWFEFNGNLGGQGLETQALFLKTEYPNGRHVHTVQLATDTIVQLAHTGETKSGALLDVDSTSAGLPTPFNAFRTNAGVLLDELHAQHEGVFFSCLTDEAIAALGPQYE